MSNNLVTLGIKGKGLIRSMSRRGSRFNMSPPVVRKYKLSEPAACDRCGAVFSRKTWRRDRRVSGKLLDQVTWTVCPGCEQASHSEYFGRVLVRGKYAAENEEAIRRRIMNVATRGRANQPEHQLVSIDHENGALEILTTSQKLAHRIARELKKAFRGKVTYSWSEDDGYLFATWER